MAKKSKAAPANRKKRGAPTSRTTRTQPPKSSTIFSDQRAASYEGMIENIILRKPIAEKYREFLGDRAYEELEALARGVRNSRAARGARRERVLILPGIMGSTLSAGSDLLWFDPFNVAVGDLMKLALPDRKKITASGLVPFYYWFLRLRLDDAGYETDYFPFDWRLSLEKTGAVLAARLKGDEDVHLVAHSMGGLVVRAALKQGMPRGQRKIIMLGTPNQGSLSPVQAFRGVNKFTNVIAKIDLKSNPTQLAAGLFTTLPGLHELILQPDLAGLDLFKIEAWPGSGVRPHADRLKRAQQVFADDLAPAIDNLHIIAGVGQETPIAVRLEDDEFAYSVSTEGDGSVPIESARLDGARTYYVEEGHGRLPASRRVGKAVIDILESGTTDRLSTTAPVRRQEPRWIKESELRKEFEASRAEARRQGPFLVDRREALSEFLSIGDSRRFEEEALEGDAPEASTKRGDEIGAPEYVMTAWNPKQRVEIGFVTGDIVDVDTRAIVVGLFEGVRQAGAAKSIDNALGGAISALTARGMFQAQLGEVQVFPAARRGVKCEQVVFAGLGKADAFSSESLQAVATNLIRTLTLANIEEAAVVPLGSSLSVVSNQEFLQSFLRGVKIALEEGDAARRFRGLRFCSRDATQVDYLCESFKKLALSNFFEPFEISYRREYLPARPAPEVRSDRLISSPSPAYLQISVATDASGIKNFRFGASAAAPRYVLHGMLISPRASATSLRFDKPILKQDFDKLTARFAREDTGFAETRQIGAEIWKSLLDDAIRHALSSEELRSGPLVIHHDALASRIPWEAVHAEGKITPAIDSGVSRLFLDGPNNAAKWLSKRQREEDLSVLLVVDPTADLPGAKEEGEAIQRSLEGSSGIRVRRLFRREATRRAVVRELSSGDYDVFHYAGHAFFDANSPGESGLICSDDTLRGADLAACTSLPQLIVLNACQSGRMRKKPVNRGATREATSVAETLLKSGASNLIATFWEVGDAAAAEFAQTLYAALLNHAPLGEAVLKARKELHKADERDWCSYMHYGDPAFRVKYA